jgi:hypothetical protein
MELYGRSLVGDLPSVMSPRSRPELIGRRRLVALRATRDEFGVHRMFDNEQSA